MAELPMGDPVLGLDPARWLLVVLNIDTKPSQAPGGEKPRSLVLTLKQFHQTWHRCCRCWAIAAQDRRCWELDRGIPVQPLQQHRYDQLEGWTHITEGNNGFAAHRAVGADSCFEQSRNRALSSLADKCQSSSCILLASNRASVLQHCDQDWHSIRRSLTYITKPRKGAAVSVPG